MAANWKEIGKVSGAIGGGVIAFFAMLFGGMILTYGWGKDVGQAEISRLTHELESKSKALSRAQEETGSLKVQIASSRETGVSNQVQAIRADGTKPTPSTDNPFSPPPTVPGIFRATVESGNSVRLFDGQLIVSLVGVQFGGTPLRYRTMFNAVQGSAIKSVENGDVGQRLTVGIYTITVLGITSSSMTIQASRK